MKLWEFWYNTGMRKNTFPYGIEFDDVLIRPAYSTLSSRSSCQTEVKIVKGEREFRLNPIIVANMLSIANPAMYKALCPSGILVPFHRYQSIDDELKRIDEAVEVYLEARRKDLHVFNHVAPVSATIGLHDMERTEKICKICNSLVDFIFLELAHADTKDTLVEVERLARNYPDKILVVGNVATSAACERLIGAGADIIKVGCGPGFSCRTRDVTGCGVPQLTAIMECAEVIEKYTEKYLIADGGIRSSGDCVKALAAGADLVMAGKIFAGTDEADYHLADGTCLYFGMASKDAQEIGGKSKPGTIPEGISTQVPVSGPASKVAENLLAGIRQGMAMVGAETIQDLQRRAEFVLVSPRTKIL